MDENDEPLVPPDPTAGRFTKDMIGQDMIDADNIETRFQRAEVEAKRVLALALKHPLRCNETYRMAYDDMTELLEFAKTVDATNADIRLWYANGPLCADRPGVISSFHPMLHKQPGVFAWICDRGQALAKFLERWVWVTIGEDRWVRIMVGPSPDDEDARPHPLYVDGKYQNDQYITTFSPNGEERFVGAS